MSNPQNRSPKEQAKKSVMTEMMAKLHGGKLLFSVPVHVTRIVDGIDEQGKKVKVKLGTYIERWQGKNGKIAELIQLVYIRGNQTAVNNLSFRIVGS